MDLSPAKGTDKEEFTELYSIIRPVARSVV